MELSELFKSGFSGFSKIDPKSIIIGGVIGASSSFFQVPEKISGLYKRSVESVKAASTKLPVCINRVSPGKAAQVGLAAISFVGIAFATKALAPQAAKLFTNLKRNY